MQSNRGAARGEGEGSLMIGLRFLLRRLIRRAAQQTVAGRLVQRDRPERGRFLPGEVDAILAQAWRNLDEMLPEAELDRIPTLGNRQNVYLSVLTVAVYRAFVDAGIERDYASELFADAGWKVYQRFVTLPRWVARLLTRDPQRQLELILRALLVYPFSHPGRPGYECRAWSEPDAFCTYWAHCPPYDFVRRWVEKHGDHGELEAFRRSWCWYDWAVARAMVGEESEARYQRPHTLSEGDDVCDMRWSASSRR
jgi:hypothetical protein